MIQAVIVDDEIKSRDTLSTLVRKYCSSVAITATAASKNEALPLLRQINPDLVFLDIFMPGGNGFDLLEALGTEHFETIFVTAYSEYALRALKAEAVDYLIKPINIAELQKAVLRAEDRINKKKGRADVWHLLQHFDKRTYGIDKIAIPVGDGLDFVQIQQIIRLAAKGSYTQLFCTGCPPILSSRPLKEYECLLPAHQFFRAHHSHIINLSFIRHYHRGEGGYVTMSDGSVIDISKRKKKQFLELFLH